MLDRLFASGKRDHWVAKLRAADIVSAPINTMLEAADALLLGQQADAVLLSVLRGVSEAPKVYAACQRLQALNIRVLGAVVNAADPGELVVAPPTPSPARAA